MTGNRTKAAKTLGYRHGRLGNKPIVLIRYQEAYERAYRKGKRDKAKRLQ